MPEIYQPTARRPIADIFRRAARQNVQFCVQHHIHADTISYASIVASLMAGGCFLLSARWHVLLLIAPLCCYLRLWFNMLDGMVAIASGSASRRGEILNDLPDRISDVIIFCSTAESGFCIPRLGYGVAIAALLTAYVGTLAQAVGTPRQFGGLMSKPWRMVALHVGTWGMWLELRWPAIGHASLSPIDIACVVILFGCLQTIFLRLARTLRALQSTNENRSSKNKVDILEQPDKV